MFFRRRKKSASLAKERLKIIVEHQRSELNFSARKISNKLLDELKDEVIEVVKKYIALSEENINDIEVRVEDNKQNSTIEVNIPFA